MGWGGGSIHLIYWNTMIREKANGQVPRRILKTSSSPWFLNIFLGTRRTLMHGKPCLIPYWFFCDWQRFLKIHYSIELVVHHSICWSAIEIDKTLHSPLIIHVRNRKVKQREWKREKMSHIVTLCSLIYISIFMTSKKTGLWYMRTSKA